MLDELPARAPRLCFDHEQVPAGSWDLQVFPPAAYGAYMAMTTAPDSPFFSSRHQVAARPARVAVTSELSDVGYASWTHSRVPWMDREWCHLHIALSAQHVDGRPTTRDEVEQVGRAAWLAYADRLVEFTTERDKLPWTRDGIERVDASWVQVDRACPWLDGVTVVVASP